MGTPGTARAARGPRRRPINFGTVAAFLAWFGGVGYLLSRYSSMWALLALSLAALSGFIGRRGGFLVFVQGAVEA